MEYPSMWLVALGGGLRLSPLGLAEVYPLMLSFRKQHHQPRQEGFMSVVQAGHPELRKALRRFPDLKLVGRGVNAHATVCFRDGTPVRHPDGRRVTIPSSPRNGSLAAKTLIRILISLGIEAR
jgi:hypothetical protein